MLPRTMLQRQLQQGLARTVLSTQRDHSPSIVQKEAPTTKTTPTKMESLKALMPST